MTEGQKAVLANEYRKILSEKAKKQRGENAIEKRWRPEQKYLSDTVSESIKAEVDTRKIASEKFKVSEWKVRMVQEIEKKAPEPGSQRGNSALFTLIPPGNWRK
ncbi:hypothetical protein B9Q06_03825 [Candidatus Marsarchaeota G2 archaeon ECH_B_2]|uniref:Uncharacterized protein n=2 Tax=Candidatus Marsarchaeota group 2 TaxID=2203771 RepID=A0A2R6BBE8_9ARCH|nr:MAG: hypothetical protein B9Q06_03825 [Candidatus Marsarchaeota G2 archaeon ECH_B_2]PSO02546.1 MAG: hypothetical protein B9Q05_04675 [Candidatus Marsarchaeota G2 archaeon ECH_B_1]